MMDLATAYFFKRYYPHVIKWWFVSYNPEVFRIWPSKAEREEALRIEKKEEHLALEAKVDTIDDDAFNATTGSYSGLYGKGPVDEKTQEATMAILNTTNSQNTIDFLLANNVNDVILPPEQDDIIKEANIIYERLLREAAEDEAKKWAEIDLIRRQTEQPHMSASVQTS